VTGGETPRSPASAQGWTPPQTPPIPPYASDDSEPDGSAGTPLTAVAWSVGGALGLVTVMFGLSVVAASLSALARTMGLEGAAFTLFVGVALSTSYLVVLGIVWLVAHAAEVTFADAVGMRRVSAGAIVGGAVLATVAGRVAAGVWGAALSYFDVDIPTQNLDPSRLFPAGALGVAMTFLVAAVLAPLAEEVVFRGILLSALEHRWGAAVAIAGSSALFAAMHISPFAIPPIFVLAVVLGWLFVRTRSLTVCIVAHGVFNGIGLALLYALRSAGVL